MRQSLVGNVADEFDNARRLESSQQLHDSWPRHVTAGMRNQVHEQLFP